MLGRCTRIILHGRGRGRRRFRVGRQGRSRRKKNSAEPTASLRCILDFDVYQACIHIQERMTYANLVHESCTCLRACMLRLRQGSQCMRYRTHSALMHCIGDPISSRLLLSSCRSWGILSNLPSRQTCVTSQQNGWYKSCILYLPIYQAHIYLNKSMVYARRLDESCSFWQKCTLRTCQAPKFKMYTIHLALVCSGE